jgi:hypothetical protein
LVSGWVSVDGLDGDGDRAVALSSRVASSTVSPEVTRILLSGVLLG